MPKHNELNINRKHEKKLRWEYNLSTMDDGPPDFRESREFAEYSAEVVRVLQKARKPMCTRQIHEALGTKANRNWTGEVLEWVDFILCIPGYVNRYAYEPNVQVRPIKELTMKDANARIFAQNGRKRLEAKV